MRTVIAAFFAFLAVGTANFAYSVDPDKKTDKWGFLPNPVAQIGDDVITKKELIENASSNIPEEELLKMSEAEIRSLSKGILDEMITDYILLKLAEKDGIKPSAELVAKVFERDHSKMTPEETKKFFRFLESQKITLDEYKKKLFGIQKIQEECAVSEWYENILRPSISVSDDEIKKFYNESAEQIKARHILIAPGNQSSEERAKAREKAEKILERIKKGEDFDKIADTENSCKAENGLPAGDMAPFSRGKMFKEFDDAAFKLKDGEISGLVESPLGYHIIKVNSRTKNELAPYDQSKDELKTQLNTLKLQDSLIEKINDFKKNNKIKIFIK